jgi:hypothetical protein
VTNATNPTASLENGGMSVNLGTLADGTKLIPNVWEGPFRIDVLSSDYRRNGFVTGTIARGDEGRTIDVVARLSAAADARVTVTRNGQPAPNMGVEVKYPGYDEFWWYGTTDDAGQLLVEAIREGQFVVRVVSDGQVVLGSATGMVTVADDGQVIPVEIAVAGEATRLYGTVFAADGETPARITRGEGSVRVELLDTASGELIGRMWSYDATFDFSEVPSSSSITVRAVSPLDPAVIAERIITPAGPETLVNLTLPVSVLKGTVTQPNGDPVFSWMRVYTENDGSWSGYNNEETGAYAFVGLPAGTFEIVARSEDSSGRTSRTGSMPGPAAVVELNLVFNVVKGRVTFHDGEGVSMPTVFATQQDPEGGEETYFPSSVDAQGNYEIQGLRPGAFTVVAREQGLEGTTSGEIADGAELPDVNVVLERDGTVTGTFTSADGGQAIGNAPVVLGIPGLNREVQSDPTTGRFEFRRVKLGAFTVHGKDPASGLVAKVAATLTMAQPSLDVALALPALGTVTGQVVQGSPAGGVGPAEVIVENKDNDGPFGAFSMTVTSDAAGFFTATGVPAGLVQVSAFVGEIGGRVSGTLTPPQPLDFPALPIGELRRLGSLSTFDLDSSGFRFDVTCHGRIRGGGTTDGWWYDTYGDAFRLNVGGATFPCVTAGALEDGDRELVIDGGVLEGIHVRRKIYVPETGGYARYLEILTNTLPTEQFVVVSLSGQFPRWWARQLFTPVADTNTTFGVLNDAGRGAQGYAFASPTASAKPEWATLWSGLSYFEFVWGFDIPAGQTRVIMHFAQQSENAPAAHDATQQFPSLTRPGMLFGLSDAERAGVVNFALP